MQIVAVVMAGLMLIALAGMGMEEVRARRARITTAPLAGMKFSDALLVAPIILTTLLFGALSLRELL